jgi:hypothetical protein
VPRLLVGLLLSARQLSLPTTTAKTRAWLVERLLLPPGLRLLLPPLVLQDWRSLVGARPVKATSKKRILLPRKRAILLPPPVKTLMPARPHLRSGPKAQSKTISKAAWRG